jgi:hypothetical protein
MEQKKFNRSEYMKEKYAEKNKKTLGINSSVLEKNKTKNEKEDVTIKAQILKEKRKIYSARAYLKRKKLKEQQSEQSVSLDSSIKKINSDSKSLIFKINNSDQKEITIRIDV